MSTTERPKRNVTAADLKLMDLGIMHSGIDALGRRLWDLMEQRDQLLEACKEGSEQLATLSMDLGDMGIEVEAPVRRALDQMEAAIERATGSGTLPGRS